MPNKEDETPEENEALDKLEDALHNLANVSSPSESGPTFPYNNDRFINLISEYLEPFIVFGYDLDGNCIVTSSAGNQRDNDALMMAIDRYMMHVTTGETDPNKE